MSQLQLYLGIDKHTRVGKKVYALHLPNPQMAWYIQSLPQICHDYHIASISGIQCHTCSIFHLVYPLTSLSKFL